MRRVLLGLVLVGLLAVAGCGPSTPLRSAQDASTATGCGPSTPLRSAQDASTATVGGPSTPLRSAQDASTDAQDAASQAGLGATRALVPPDAPVLLTGPDSYVTNAHWVGGDPELGGAPILFYTDFVVRWRMLLPVTADYFEVWRAPHNEPYFAPDTCVACELVATTTGLRVTVEDSPPPFNPIGGTAGATIGSDIDYYRVRAFNAAGGSAVSNTIGVVSYSLLQNADLPVVP